MPDLTVEQIRELVAREARTLDQLAEAHDRSPHTMRAYAGGKIPKGSAPFPTPVLGDGGRGTTYHYVAKEVAEWFAALPHKAWIAEHYTRRT